MSALTVTLGADITALRRSMAGATAMVSASAKKMASLTAAGLKVGLGAALAGGGVALAAGMKAVTSAADFEQTKVNDRRKRLGSLASLTGSSVHHRFDGARVLFFGGEGFGFGSGGVLLRQGYGGQGGLGGHKFDSFQFSVFREHEGVPSDQ